MSVEEDAVRRLEELSIKYKETYGKEIDYTIIPKGITQEKLVNVIKLMIDDNLSIVTAYHKLYGE